MSAGQPSSFWFKPPYNFYSFDFHIREDIYHRVLSFGEYIFLHQEEGSTSGVRRFLPNFQPPHLAALLLTSRQIHNETCAILYQTNKFYFIDGNTQENVIGSFLSTIGTDLSENLRHVTINFPDLTNTIVNGQTIRFQDDAIENLRLLGDNCLNLHTLEMIVNGNVFHGGVVDLGSNQGFEFAGSLFNQIQALLRSFPALERTLVKFDVMYDLHAEYLMEDLGWKVSPPVQFGN